MDKEKLFKYSFGIHPKDLPSAAIITPFIPLKRFTAYCTKEASFSGRLFSGIIASKEEGKAAIITSGVGASITQDAIMLLGASPVKRLIFTGSCGGVNTSRIGDLIMCESAFNGEGFTRYHEGPYNIKEAFERGGSIDSDAEYTKEAKKFLTKNAQETKCIKSGNIFTIGALTAESKENLLLIEEKGFSGVDMELSIAYSAAKSAGIKAAGLLIVSDQPLKKPIWEEKSPEEKNRYKRNFEDMVKLSAEFALKKT